MTNRWTTMLLAVALLIVATTPAALAGPKGIDRPIKGAMTGIVQFGGAGNHDGLENTKGCNPGAPEYFQVTTFTSADGRVSHLGRTHLESAHCNTPTGPLDGQMSFVAANGDVLYAEYTGEYTDDGIAATVVFTENTKGACYLLNDVPCESTGRFQGATGSVVMSNGVMPTDPNDDWIPWDFWGTFEGLISY